MKYTYRIEVDEYAFNPREEFDNLSTFYAVKDNHCMTGGKKDVEYTYRDDLEDEIKALRKAGAVIVEFNHRSGTQYAVVKRDQLQDEYIKFGYSTRKALYWARSCAKGEIETWKAWADGEVYGYIVEDEDGENLDSCWGFYGEEYAREGAESFIKWKIEDDKIKAAELESMAADWVE